MTAHPSLRGRHALAVLASVAAVAVAVAAFALLGGSPGPAFPAFVPAAAPAGWPHLALPDGAAVLSYPPTLRPSAATPTPCPPPRSVREEHSSSI